MSDPSEPDRHELNRRLDEMLAENRVVLPGATVLFAFLLTVPFASGFAAVSSADRAAYFVAFLATALSMILLMGQSAYHRLRGRPYDKALMLRTANRQAVAAIALLAVAMAAVIYLVADVLYPGHLALPIAAGVFLFALVTWFYLPLQRRARQDR